MRKLYACFVHRKKIALGIDQQEIINTLKKYLILDDNDINQRFPHNKKFLTIFFVADELLVLRGIYLRIIFVEAKLKFCREMRILRASSAPSGQRRNQGGLWGLT